jgi:arylsulfatase
VGPPFSIATILSLGWISGCSIGALAGLAECLALPLGEPARIPYAVGIDAFLAGGWGFLTSLVLATCFAKGNPGPRALRALVAALLFPAFAVSLGLFANKVLLPGTHFLSFKSLVADAIALFFALGLALAASRGVRAPLGGSVRAAAPPVALACLAVAIALVTVPPFFLARGAPDPSRPTIVLVSIDTLRPDRLSCGGEPEPSSPEIDRLSRESTFFAEAVTVSPASAPSHAALLTSRYPISNGVWTNFSVMDSSVTTLAEELRAKGYRTGGFTTNTFLGKRFGFDQGFDVYVESGMVERLEEPSGAALARSPAIVQVLDRLKSRFRPGFDPSFETALQWIGESNRPSFLFVHIMDVHSPHVPVPPWGSRFSADPSGGEGSRARRNRFGWRASIEVYLAEIRFADSKIGRLRRTLEERGLLESSIWVMTSDHGEHLLDHEPVFSHGTTLFDATSRILISIRGEGFARGKVEPAPFENIDLLPAIWSRLSWGIPDEWQGKDLARIPPAPRIAYSQLGRDFAARSRDWKLIVKESGVREFYDLSLDPAEESPKALSREETSEIETQLALWFEKHAGELYLSGARTILPADLPPETVAKLRALGYLP